MHVIVDMWIEKVFMLVFQKKTKKRKSLHLGHAGSSDLLSLSVIWAVYLVGPTWIGPSRYARGSEWMQDRIFYFTFKVSIINNMVLSILLFFLNHDRRVRAEDLWISVNFGWDFYLCMIAKLKAFK